jgi:hypothetical protein
MKTKREREKERKRGERTIQGLRHIFETGQSVQSIPSPKARRHDVEWKIFFAKEKAHVKKKEKKRDERCVV